jgi:glycosyltransferase involved in cell wall biosynthesis
MASVAAGGSITLFIPSLHGGGAERAMLMFSVELLRRGFAVDLVIGAHEGGLQDLVPHGVRLIVLGTSRLSHGLFGLVRHLRVTKPLALYSTITNANVIAAVAGQLAGSCTRIVVRQSNVPITEPKSTWRRQATAKLLPRAYRLAHGVIAVSEGVASELRTLEPRLADRIRVIPTPVVSEAVLAQGEEGAPHSWLQGEGTPVVLTAARLEPHKGLHTLLTAFARVRARRDARLIIIGEGSERSSLERKVQELGLQEHVSLPGFQRNPYCFMSKANAFVLASEFEGLPNVLIQAMAFGTPVVATDCKSGPREILDGGRMGALVPVGDVAAIADAINVALDTPRQDKTAMSIREHYGAARAAGEYLQLAGL